MSKMRIPYNQPYMAGKELDYISEAHERGHLSGDGEFTRRCNQWLEEATGAEKVLLTHSCTAALEMAALLAGIGPGDEVIMPSYTFVSTANAFVLRGATPVFVDIREDTMNIDESLIEQVITEKTRAIVPVHYAGVGCEMDTIMDIARRHDLRVIEDAAQGVLSSYRGRPLGTIGDMGTLSFHETKNVISGEGGAILLNHSKLGARAEIIREKGTNRNAFFRGEVDKYSWVDVGSSYLPSDLIAAFLWAQLESAKDITQRRLAIWTDYNDKLEALEAEDCLRRPVIPPGCTQNAHMYYILLPSLKVRNHVIEQLRSTGIQAIFHYVPLHASTMGREVCKTPEKLTRTEELSDRLLRLPLWLGMDSHVGEIVEEISNALHLA
jgi:dTDP-4-amino-4,6-dideoxygalactose transaminase